MERFMIVCDNGIFMSVNGEICLSHQGSVTTFLRLFGCNNRCNNCDTPQSYEKNYLRHEMSVLQVFDKLIKNNTKNITITGGEPLLQIDEVMELSQKLLLNGKNISVETNGSIYIPYFSFHNIDYRNTFSWVADYKLPSTRMNNKMDINNFKNLTTTDFIKFVVADREDFNMAVHVINDLLNRFTYRKCPIFAFSPSFDIMDPLILTQWMMNEPELKKIGAVFSWQIHKLIGVV